MNIVGASLEVLEHHARQHPCGFRHSRDLLCPCRTTVMLTCPRCGEPVFMAAWPGTWCRHAEQLLTGVARDGLWSEYHLPPTGGGFA